MKRIVALIDFSEVTPALVKIAREMARAFNCELLLVHVIVSESELSDDERADDAPSEAAASRAHHRQMEILTIALAKEGVNATAVVVPTKRAGDNPAPTLVAEIGRLCPDLIVMGSHGHGRLHQLLAGSVTDTIVRKSPCPVLIVPSRIALKSAS